MVFREDIKDLESLFTNLSAAKRNLQCCNKAYSEKKDELTGKLDKALTEDFADLNKVHDDKITSFKIKIRPKCEISVLITEMEFKSPYTSRDDLMAVYAKDFKPITKRYKITAIDFSKRLFMPAKEDYEPLAMGSSDRL